jgi:hypothetical protein
MAETLLTPSGIKLYGRVMSSLHYYDDTDMETRRSRNNFLQNQLSGVPIAISRPGGVFQGQISPAGLRHVALNGSIDDIRIGMVVTAIEPAGKQFFPPGTHVVSIDSVKPASITISANPLIDIKAKAGITVDVTFWDLGKYLARIYAFSFEGAIYSVPKPAIFIVHGAGDSVNERPLGDRSTVDQSGVVAKEWEFSGPNDLQSWEYEKGDFSVRFDTEAGPFDQLLLQASLRSGADRADRSGAGLEIRSGAGLSGAGVSGAGVSGAGLSGAGLSGAGLKR